MAEWKPPVGYSDPDGGWSNETNAYDENTGTYALCGIIGTGRYLYLTFEAGGGGTKCSKVRVYAKRYYAAAAYDPDIDIDLDYLGGWQNIHSGSITKETWVEFDVPGGQRLVTTARIKWNEDSGGLHLHEFAFYDTAPVSVVLKTINPKVVLGDTLVTPSPSSFITDTVNPIVLIFPPYLRPAPALFVITGIDPNVVHVGLKLKPDPASFITDTVNPTVIKGDIALTPASASMVLSTVNPTVIKGSISLTPTPASFIWETTIYILGRPMKLVVYTKDYSDLRVYTKDYLDLRVFTSEVPQ